MFARVSTFQESPEGIAESIRRLPETQQRVEAMDLSGLKGIYYLVDRHSGKTLTITLWETEQDLKASEEAANQVRGEEAEATGGQIVDVERFEVVAADLF